MDRHMNYKIGDLYSPATKTSRYVYRSPHHELGLILSTPTPEEIRRLNDCQVEVAIYVEGDVICFLYNFQREIPWSDTPFSYHLMPPAERTVPSDPAELLRVERDRVDIVLVNEKTFIVEEVRRGAFSHRFTVGLREAIIEQANLEWHGQAMWNRRVREIYARYTTSESMLMDCQARCFLQGLKTRW